MPMSTVPEVLDALRCGRMIIVIDDQERENEGDLVVAGQYVTQEQMTFIIRHTGGVVCLALSNDIANQLDLPEMVSNNTSKLKTAFTVSIEAAQGVTTGVSAHDRVQTVRAAINPVARPDDLFRPGHIFPLRSRNGGVLWRAGHTEASIDLCRLSGLREGAVLSELMRDDGTMMRFPQLNIFARQYDLPIVSIADIIAYRRCHETFVRLEAKSKLETEYGVWDMSVYRDTLHHVEHVSLVMGHIDPLRPTLVRVHSECLTGDVFGSQHCDCGDQLASAMRHIANEGTGVILYMRQEGRGIGLVNKIRAYDLQNRYDLDTVDANAKLGFAPDLREYGIGAQILKEIGMGKLRILTNNPKKVVGLQGYGLEIIDQVPIEICPISEKQKKYLRTKKEKMNHRLRFV
jgi:3,4-dihydroxy 2-butanone 4-phosphate synthase / GTP cyclohydrolase II